MRTWSLEDAQGVKSSKMSHEVTPSKEKHVCKSLSLVAVMSDEARSQVQRLED